MITAKDYIGDKAFQKILNELQIDFPVPEMKMYLLGLLLSVEFVPPSHALEEILLAGTEDEVQFNDKKHAQKFYDAFSGLWNNLASFLNTDNYPALVPIPTKFKNNSAKVDFLMNKSNEIMNFLIGLEESGTCEFFESDLDLFLATKGFIIVENILTNFTERAEDGEPIKTNEINDLIQVAHDLNDLLWPQKFPIINKRLYGIRTGTIKLQDPKEVIQKSEEILEESKLC